MHLQNLVQFCLFILNILSGNEILTPMKGHNSITNLQKMTGNNPNQDIVNINAYTIRGSKKLSQRGSNFDSLLFFFFFFLVSGGRVEEGSKYNYKLFAGVPILAHH